MGYLGDRGDIGDMEDMNDYPVYQYLGHPSPLVSQTIVPTDPQSMYTLGHPRSPVRIKEEEEYALTHNCITRLLPYIVHRIVSQD